MAAYNATNRLNRGDPDTDITSSTFGQALFQGSPGGTFGQQGATYRNRQRRPAGGARIEDNILSDMTRRDASLSLCALSG